jgi:hypothetical protein
MTLRFHQYCLLLVLGLFWNSPARCDSSSGVIRATKRKCEVSTDGGQKWIRAKANTELKPGALIRTGPKSSADLFLGDNGPVVKLMENSLLSVQVLDKKVREVEKIITTELDLHTGELSAKVKKLASASRYTVKFPRGAAEVSGTWFDLKADGTILVNEGRVLVTYQNEAIKYESVSVNSGEMMTWPVPGSTGPQPKRVTRVTLERSRSKWPPIIGCKLEAPPKRAGDRPLVGFR